MSATSGAVGLKVWANKLACINAYFTDSAATCNHAEPGKRAVRLISRAREGRQERRAQEQKRPEREAARVG